MTPKTLQLTSLGVLAVAAGAIIYRAATALPDPPIGWWGQPVPVYAPCPQTPPGPVPYLPWVNPTDAKGYYFRFEGSVRPSGSGFPEGHLYTALGGDHTLGAQLDDMEIPLVSGECPPTCAPDGKPVHIYPAPWRDVFKEGSTTVTICDVYRNGSGPRAKPCPSGATPGAYSASIKQMPQWSSTNAARQAEIAKWCNRTPTPTVPPAVTPTAAVTAIPVANPYAAWMEQLYHDGITSGCQQNPPRACPDAPLLRQEAAVWIEKAKRGAGYVPPPCTGFFVDMPCDSAITFQEPELSASFLLRVPTITRTPTPTPSPMSHTP